MAKRQRGKGKPGEAPGPGQQQRPQGGGGGGGWAPLRDAIRRDIEQAITALAFADRLHTKMDTQRRVFLDFPHAMEQLRSGAMERVATALSRLYEGGQGFDLQRFIRDLPTALAQLAAADRSKSQPPPAETSTSTGTGTTPSTETSTSPSTEPATSASTAAPEPSPRLELRAKLLAAAPQLAKAAQSYRRNVATLKRAALPRRSPGPWRADREVLEEAHRAVEFVQKLYDAYAEAWADQPVTANLAIDTAAEVDRFLAWTQLDRYVELAVLASTNAPRPPKPGQHVISAPHETPAATQASEGAGGTIEPEKEKEKEKENEKEPEKEPEAEAKPAENQPVAEPEPGRA
jgi:hypothetical protein